MSINDGIFRNNKHILEHTDNQSPKIEVHITQKICYSSQTVGNIQKICNVMYQQMKQYINERDCVDFTFAWAIFAILK